MLTIVKCVLKFQDDLYNQKFLIKIDAQSVKYMFDKDYKHDASKLMFAKWQTQLAPFDFEIHYKKGRTYIMENYRRMEPPWVTKGRGKGNNPRGRGRYTPSSSRSAYGSSSNTPIIQKGGMSLFNLNSKAQEAASSVHLKDIPENNPLYTQLHAYLSQKQSNTLASITKDDVDDIKSYEKIEKTRNDIPLRKL
ncbi:hypothetical protein H5410_060963 [Solanum commersonii]|uniref:Uncharacterized protein n=1 Tax=Solanum commersonii TaxID=4109 RepID=A0A9J5W6F9_SOLCO|nr:hypothetical protein H5410_060963 [Solanum commersonii]